MVTTQHDAMSLEVAGLVCDLHQRASYAVLLDDIQRREQDGPCRSVPAKHRVVRIDDLAAGARWPRYAWHAMTATPIWSVLSVQVPTEPHGMVVMERFNIGAVQAFRLLKRLSQTSNAPVAVVAHRLVDADRPSP